MVLNFKRYITLWERDKGYIIGNIAEHVGMASAAGGILAGKAHIKIDPSILWIFNPEDVDSVYTMTCAISLARCLNHIKHLNNYDKTKRA
eukprot:7934077-Ditylum_brightwellii.AAC.1